MDAINVDKCTESKDSSQPQCQFFVVRKKRLCRMTVRPGRDYCGEHEPQPRTEKGKGDIRIPCPYDPKHTCYASKLLKHLAICNSRQTDIPNYIIHNINAPPSLDIPTRTQLCQIPQQKILALIDKVNILYEKYVKEIITTVIEQPIHNAVKADFTEEGRANSSLRHLRQASSLLHIMEAEGLVQDKTCYVELGAGKGQLSYYAYRAWCDSSSSRVLLVDRASLRHKRDNKLRETTGSGSPGTCRIRADLAHLALEKVPEVAQCDAVVGFAKHLCGAATDYALRCVLGPGVEKRLRGLVIATCCHHRCEPSVYLAMDHLEKMGITAEDFNIILGAVSWATCGDGHSRERRNATLNDDTQDDTKRIKLNDNSIANGGARMEWELRARAGRRAKALLDYGRACYLRERGFNVRLAHYVSTDVSLENVAIIATKI